MTISELKRAMDRRFDRLQQTRVERAEFRTRVSRVRGEIAASADQTRAYVDVSVGRLGSSLRKEIAILRREVSTLRQEFSTARLEVATAAVDTKRHFDAVGELIRADIRVFADGPVRQTERLDEHEVRVQALERHST